MFEQGIGDHALEHADFHVNTRASAQALKQCRHEPVRRDEAGTLVRDDARRKRGFAIAREKRGGDPALALDDVVVGRAAGVGTAFEIAVERAVDDVGLARHDVVGGETEGGDFLRADVVYEDIRAVDQAPQRRACRRAFQIEAYAAFVAVTAEKTRGHAGIARRADTARRIAARRFDFDHIGAVIAEYLRGIRSEQYARQIDDPDPGQRRYE